MARIRRKADLPIKTCVFCGRPFTWRKQWARDWENVKYCSERCRAAPIHLAAEIGAVMTVFRIILGDQLSVELSALADLDQERDIVLIMEV